MRQLQFVAYKMYSYDTDSFVEAALDYSRDSMIFVFDFEKIKCLYHPADIRLSHETIRFLTFRSQRLNRWLAPLRFLSNIGTIFFLFLVVITKYRPRVCWMENTYAAFITGFLRKLNFCQKTFYLPGDWLVTNRFKNPLSYFGSNILFPLLDYCACRWNDIVLNHMQAIADARDTFWKRKIAKKEGLYAYQWKINAPLEAKEGDRMTLCFLGSPREDSGLGLAISSLKELRRSGDFTLKIIGPKRQHYAHFRQLAAEMNVEPYVNFMGFIETRDLPQALADCFCGLNLVSSTESYSSFTIPGKLVHYFQYLLPVIATPGAGPMAEVISNAKIGVIVEPERNAFIGGIKVLYENKDQFRRNIINYINGQPHASLKELIERN